MKKECECGCCNNSFGVASFILGLLSIVFGVALVGIIFGILGLIFGIVQYKKMKNAWAIWGIVLSGLGILISVLVIWKLVIFVQTMQQVIQTCAADPTQPGCEAFAQLAT